MPTPLLVNPNKCRYPAILAGCARPSRFIVPGRSTGTEVASLYQQAPVASNRRYYSEFQIPQTPFTTHTPQQRLSHARGATARRARPVPTAHRPCMPQTTLSPRSDESAQARISRDGVCHIHSQKPVQTRSSVCTRRTHVVRDVHCTSIHSDLLKPCRLSLAWFPRSRNTHAASGARPCCRRMLTRRALHGTAPCPVHPTVHPKQRFTIKYVARDGQRSPNKQPLCE